MRTRRWTASCSTWGLAPAMGQEEKLLGRKLALRTSFGGTMMSAEFTNVHANHVSPETALALGADAVVMMLVMGGADYRSAQAMARDIDAYHRLQIPVIVEVLADDYGSTQTFDVQANGARVAAELGADVVKGFYTEKIRQGRERLSGAVPPRGRPARDGHRRDRARGRGRWHPRGWPSGATCSKTAARMS